MLNAKCEMFSVVNVTVVGCADDESLSTGVIHTRTGTLCPPSTRFPVQQYPTYLPGTRLYTRAPLSCLSYPRLHVFLAVQHLLALHMAAVVMLLS